MNSPSSHMQVREQQLRQWSMQYLSLSIEESQWSMVSGDASFRRYFRLSHDTSSWIAVDAPPEHENSEQFCKVAALFRGQGCRVPEVFASDLQQGFMLLSDLGDRQLLRELNDGNAQHYYRLAFNQLLCLQSSVQAGVLADYDRAVLMNEMGLFQQWFLKTYLGFECGPSLLSMIEAFQQHVCERVLEQQQVYVHRDFHSRNLMIVEDGLALIDFQDALLGPITYDALSLLKDVYIEWPVQRRREWLAEYFAGLQQKAIVPAELSFESFYQDFEWMGIQRHLKILGIFARLSLRDGKHGYLKDLPLTFHYIEEALQGLPGNDNLIAFRQFFCNELKARFLEFVRS